MLLFLALLVTFALLTAGEFGVTEAHKIGGYFGILTALIAWYNALAGLLEASKSSIKLPVGQVK